MAKSLVLIFLVLYGSEVRASPSVTRTSSSEELKHMIEVTISQTIKDILLTTTTTPAPGLISKEKIDSVAPSWQIEAAQNLTKYLEELVKGVNNLMPPSTTPVPASAYEERFQRIERTMHNLTDSLAHLDTTVWQLMSSTMPPLCGSDSGYEYSSVTMRCYKLHTEEVRWSAADSACNAERGYLAILDTNEEARFIGDIAKRISKQLYIGVYRNSAGNWRTVNGDAATSSVGFVWASSEPYTEAKWRFATLSTDYKIISRMEEDKYPFICEKAP